MSNPMRTCAMRERVAQEVGRPTKADCRYVDQRRSITIRALRASAAVSLWLMNRDAKKAVLALSKHLADEDDTVSTTSAFALAAIGPDAVGAVPESAQGLEARRGGPPRPRRLHPRGDRRPPLRMRSRNLNQLLGMEKEKLPSVPGCRALWASNKQTDGLLPVLVLALAEDDADLNLQASETLGKIAAESADPKSRAAACRFQEGIARQGGPRPGEVAARKGPTTCGPHPASALGAIGQDAALRCRRS